VGGDEEKIEPPPVWGSWPHPTAIGRLPHFLPRGVVARADTRVSLRRLRKRQRPDRSRGVSRQIAGSAYCVAIGAHAATVQSSS
jgi:hypothetical protein